MTDQEVVVYVLSNIAIFNDLEQAISKLCHYLTRNISEMVRYNIVTTKY